MVKFAVCDDEQQAAAYISDKLIELYPGECEVKSYPDGNSLLADMRRESFDALFLDIGMPLMDGMELAGKIREDDPYIKIVFVTNRTELANLGYIYGAFRFVRKSSLEQELREALYSLNECFNSFSENLILKTPSGVVSKPPSSIQYFEVKGHTVTMVCNDGKIQVCGTMSEYNAMLENRGFIRVHKSYLVNRRYIDSVQKSDVKLSSGGLLPLSRKRAEDVKNKLNAFLINSGK
ncbi:MAG: LytTR family DNA-binding domain-containing protein [Oscillospiraceae bacterium]|nr:LytTR family DNA-binding domain-containing protein [Oscillospiraceae bacterium]